MKKEICKELDFTFRSKLLNSIASPIEIAQNHLSDLSMVAGIKKVFEEKSWAKFVQLGKTPLGYNSVWVENSLENQLFHWKWCRPYFHVKAKSIIDEHTHSVQDILAKLQSEPYKRDFSWIPRRELGVTESLINDEIFDLYHQSELDRLKRSRYSPFRIIREGMKEVDMIQNEITRFENLTRPDQYHVEWADLHDYPDDDGDKVNIHELYIAIQDYRKGTFEKPIYSTHHGRLKLWAKAKAVMDYIKFLRSEIDSKGTQDETLSSPHPKLKGETEQTHQTTVNITSPLLQDQDPRIVLSQEAMEYVMHFFNQLALDKNGMQEGELVMCQQDIEYLIQANFKDSRSPLEPRLLKTGLKVTHLCRYIGCLLNPLLYKDGCYIDHPRTKRFLKENFHKCNENTSNNLGRYLNSKSETMHGHLRLAMDDMPKRLKKLKDKKS